MLKDIKNNAHNIYIMSNNVNIVITTQLKRKDNALQKRLLKCFNEQLEQFFLEYIRLFPENRKLKYYYMPIKSVMTMTPKEFIDRWRFYILQRFKTQILGRDKSFFEPHRFDEEEWNDFSKSGKNFMKIIASIKASVLVSDETIVNTTFDYLTNLTKLCIAYFEPAKNISDNQK